jgi:PAS domain S-box-containing protein
LKKRIALAFALLTAVCVVTLTLFAFLQSEAALRTSILRETAAALSKTDLQIELILEDTKKDVIFLAGASPVRGMQRALQAGGYDRETQSDYAIWAERLQQIMGALLRSKPSYWQARYLDEHGQERVRVDRLDGTIVPVAERALQNKAAYAYFSETMQLAPGAIYVSPLNLNREHGHIATPPQAMLRVATPIVDRMGKRRGIVVINLHAEGLLGKIHAPIQALGGQTYLVDQDGYFLAHPDPGKTFGFDRGFDYRLRQVHPRLADMLHGMNSLIEHATGAELPGVESHVHGFDRIAYDPNNPGNYWAVVFDLPDSVAFAPVAALRNNLLGIGLLIGVLGTFAGLFWAGRFSRQATDLAGTAGKIAQGNAHLRVDTATLSDEFLVLGRALNRMLDELTTSERRFTNIVNLAADAIISVDEAQNIRIFNQGAERIFGYPAAEMLGQPLDRLLPARVAGAHHEHVRRFAAEPDTSRGMNRRPEIHGRRKDGSEFPAEASISKVEENGQFQLTVFLRDVSERERAEQTLQQKDKLLTMVGAMAKVGGWEFDARTRKGTWTDEVARIHDMDPKEQTSVETGLRFYQGESRTIIEAAVKDAIEHAQPYDLELEMITAKGNPKWVRTIGQPVMLDGAVVKVWGSFQDITGRKHVEEEIRRLNADLERKVIERTAELLAVNKELESFSYSVSHDLRAPLRAIDGFSQAVIEDYADRLDEQAKDYLNRVRAATQRMGHLIDDMLGLARVARVEMRRDAVDLSALAADVLAELQKSEPARRVECRIEPGLVASGDARLLRQALVNLLDNAWKYTARQPLPRIEFGALRNAQGATDFFVRDNGAGFDMAYVGKLFGVFQRLHLQSEFPGTGVGLATVQRIIHRHGGQVRGEGVPGRGATFYFTLPASGGDGGRA